MRTTIPDTIQTALLTILVSIVDLISVMSSRFRILRIVQGQTFELERYELEIGW